MSELILRKRDSKKIILFFLLIVAIIIATKISEFNFVKSIISLPKAFYWMIINFIPSANDFKYLGDIIIKLFETILLAIAATTVAAGFAILFSLMGSTLRENNKIMSSIVRAIACIFRNIPEAVWAMVFLLSFGQNILTGYFALFFVSFGMLTRAFLENIDEVSKESVQALSATGSSFLQIVRQSILPSCSPQILSWILYMIETNIRSSTLIGILTGTGIGFLFDIYYKSMNYGTAGLIIIVIVIAVIGIELLSNSIRRRII